MQDDYVTQQKAIVQQLKDSLRQRQDQISVVQMRSDYENDPELSLTSVIFPPESIVQTILTQVIQPLQRIEPNHFYYSGDLLHITIKNVRVMHHPPRYTQADVAQVRTLFAQIVPLFPPFTFSLEGAIVFPTSISLIAYCGETLRKLVQALDQGLREIGLPDDKQYISDTVFFGNMTVCRFTQPPSREFLDRVNDLSALHLGTIPVTQLHLVTCNCVCSRRTLIDTVSLAA